MAGSVYAVVVTYNRKELLIECLDALARQTHPLERVLVVDNASTDGTPELLVESGIASRLPVDYLRLDRNGGGAEGFHYGVRTAREHGSDWIWLMDDDCAPAPDSLEQLLASPRAADPGAVLLAPVVTRPGGEVLPFNRGRVRPRWFFGPILGLEPEDLERPETRVDHVSLVGPLVRTEAARRTDPPRREFFIWWDDLEWVLRLGRLGALWLVPASRIAHADPRPMESTSLRTRWRDFRDAGEFRGGWKRAYGLRNLLHCGRREGFFTPARALSFVAVWCLRGLLFESHRRRTLRLTVMYARDGWRGTFRNVPPGEWAALADHPDPRRHIEEHALRYDRDTAGEVRPLAELAGVAAGEGAR